MPPFSRRWEVHTPLPTVTSFRAPLLRFGRSLGSFSTCSARMIAEPELDKTQPNTQSLYHPFQEGTLRHNAESSTHGRVPPAPEAANGLPYVPSQRHISSLSGNPPVLQSWGLRQSPSLFRVCLTVTGPREGVDLPFLEATAPHNCA